MTNRYTQQAASAGYYGIFDGGDELSHAETVARLNELEERVAGLQGELDAARGHVEGLVKWAPHPQYAINDEQRAAIVAARAWLRRAE